MTNKELELPLDAFGKQMRFTPIAEWIASAIDAEVEEENETASRSSL